MKTSGKSNAASEKFGYYMFQLLIMPFFDLFSHLNFYL